MKTIISILLLAALTITFIFSGCSQPAPTQAVQPAPKPSAAPAPAPAPATAAKVVELKLASFGALPHCNVATCIKWYQEIEQRSNGRIKFTPYWGGSLLKAGALYDGVVKSIADVIMDMPAYNPGQFPVAEIVETIWGYPSSLVASQVARDVVVKYKPAELADTHFLYLSSLGSNGIFSNKPVKTMDDIKGLKMRSTGNTVEIVKKLGASPISMPITDTYDALRKNTVDGTLTGIEALQMFKLAEVVKYATPVSCIGYTSINWTIMNQQKWNALPKDLQDIFNEVSEKYTAINGVAWDTDDKAGVDFAKKLGVEFIELSQAEKDKISAAMVPVRDDLLAKIATKGIPAQDIGKFIKESILKYNK